MIVVFLVLPMASVFNPGEAKASPVTISCNSTAVDEAGNAGNDVTFTDGGDGICIFDASASFASVVVETGVTLTHASADATGVDITTTGNFQIDSGGKIDVSAMGSAADTGTAPGTTTNIYSSSGAGHGGAGGEGGLGSAAGAVYGSSWEQGAGTGPTTLGSGGDTNGGFAGGAGGGYVRLNVSGTLTVNGQILADGQSGTGTNNSGTNGSGGGSGGSIYITTNVYSGSGAISAAGGQGGMGNDRGGGGGGGGRILVEYATTTLTSLNTTLEGIVDVSGGAVGGGDKDSEAADPSEPGSNGTAMFVDKAVNADYTDATVYIFDGFRFQDGEENGTAKFQFDTINILGSTVGTDDVLIYNTTAASEIEATTATLSNVDWNCSSITSLVLDFGTLNLNNESASDAMTIATGCGDVTLNATTAITSILDNLTMTADSFDWNLGNDITITDSTITTTDTTASSFTIDDAINVALGSGDSANASTITASADWSVSSITIYAGSSIDADGLGSAATAGTAPGGYSSNGCGGAGHGGAGGLSGLNNGTAGSTYGSSTAPVTVGSGGGCVNGGVGGGAIKLQTSGTLNIRGTITADGTDGAQAQNGNGGGSGGSIYLIALTDLQGNGTLSAFGGAGGDGINDRGGGGGGGGRVSVVYASDSSSIFTSETAASLATAGAGGASINYPGSAGTVGTLSQAAITAPTTPSITAPADLATGVSRAPTITTSVYSGDLTHTYTDWEIAEDSGFTKIIWSSLGDADDLESIVVNSSKGTFAGRHAGSTQLGAGAFYVRARHANGVGESSSSTVTSFTTTNTAPSSVGSLTASQKTDGSGMVDLSFPVDDADDDDIVEVRVEVYDGSTWTDATLSTADNDTTATYGDPDIDNGDTYQVGNAPSSYIITSSGANTINVDWDAGSDFPGLDTSSAQFKVTPYDQGDAGITFGLTSITVDLVAPVAASSFAKSSGSGTTADMTWVAGSDTNFNHYEIWYGTNQTDVQNKNGTAIEWDDTSDDVNLATVSTTTTTITGLTAGLTYYALICAVDDYGYSTCTSDISFVTNQTPTVTTPSSISQATNGTGYVTFLTTVADADSDETKLKVEYSEDGGSSWYDADLVSATPDQGAVDLDDAQAYQIGTVNGIDTDSANTTLTIVWDSKSASNGNGAVAGEQSDIQVRVTANDSIIDSSVGTSTSFSIDNGGPVGLASFSASATTSSTITWTWTAATSEGSFSHYEIWYGENQSDVENRTGTATEWDNSDDTDLATMVTTTTTITGLSENTTYYAKIWAVDTNNNVTTLSASTANNNGRPTLSSLSATEATDASGEVTIQFTIDDADDDDTLQALVEYNIGSGWVKLNLSELSADVSASATTPDVDIENDNTYQIGNAAGYILSSSGANTIRTLWPTLSDGGSAFSTNSAQIRITPYDGTEAGSAVTLSNVTLDNVGPSGLGSLSANRSASNTLDVSWDAATDANFDYYELWYGTNSTDVSNRNGTATKWDTSDDSNMTAVATTSTTITGASTALPGVTYYIKIVAIDTYGNESTLAVTSFSTGVSGGSTRTSTSSSRAATAEKVKTLTAKENPILEKILAEKEKLEEEIVAEEEEKSEEVAIEVERDSDNDGLTDSEEATYGTNPNEKDSDGDGLTDGFELNQYHTNPLAIDTDKDGFEDGYEISIKSDPNDTCSPGNVDLDPAILKLCEGKTVDPNEDLRRIKKKVLFVGLPEEKDVPVMKEIIETIITENENRKERNNLAKLNENAAKSFKPLRGQYDINTVAGKIQESIETKAFEEAPWSEKHFKQLLKNEAIANNLDKSEELAKFITNVVSEPNKNVSQLDSLKLIIVTSMPSEKDSTIDAIINDFNEESLKVAENRQLFVNSEDIKPDAELTRGQALTLLFKTGDAKFRSEFIESTVGKLNANYLPFSDVDVSSKYAPYISYFNSKGYINGYSDGTFRPEAPMTNAEFIKILNIMEQEAEKNRHTDGVSMRSTNLQLSLFGADRVKLYSIEEVDKRSIIISILGMLFLGLLITKVILR